MPKSFMDIIYNPAIYDALLNIVNDFLETTETNDELGAYFYGALDEIIPDGNAEFNLNGHAINISPGYVDENLRTMYMLGLTHRACIHHEDTYPNLKEAFRESHEFYPIENPLAQRLQYCADYINRKDIHAMGQIRSVFHWANQGTASVTIEDIRGILSDGLEKTLSWNKEYSV
jgi:hypothetical protein